MPKLKDIEQFKPLLNSLGNEPEILEEQGLTIEDVPPPQEGIPEDIRNLFTSEEHSEQGEDALLPSDEGEAPSKQDFDLEQPGAGDFLSSLDKVEQIPGKEEEGGLPLDSKEALALEGLEELTLDGEEDLSLPIAEPPAEPPAEPDDTLAKEELKEEVDETEESEFSLEETIDRPLGKEETPEGEALDFGESPQRDETEEPGGGFEFGEMEFPDDSAVEEGREEPLSFEESGAETVETERTTENMEDTILHDLREETLEEHAPPKEEIGPSEEESPPREEEFALPDIDIPEESDTEEVSFGDSSVESPSAPGEPGAAPIPEEAPFSKEEDFSEEEDFETGDTPLPSEEKETAEDDETFDISDFSLGDLGAQFGIDEEPGGAKSFLDPALSQTGKELSEGEFVAEGDSEESSAKKEGGGEEFSLNDDDFRRLRENLWRLPRNLKLIIEEQIGEQGLRGEPLENVLKALVRGARAKELAAILSEITGEPIAVPDRYERLTGEGFEEEKGTFAYVLKNNVLPLLRFFLLGATALGLLAFFIFQYVYTPLHANTLYRAGIVEIQKDNYRGGNEYFNQAVAKWRVKKWYYTYAENLAAKRQYPLAEEKYEQLLAVPKYRGDHKALLDYARLESETLGKYPEAEELLKRVLNEDAYQQEAILLMGDNYLRWGDEIDPKHWEEARYHYALLMQKYGLKPIFLFRILRYLIREDKYPEIIQIKDTLQANSQTKIEADGYAELAEYLLDRGEQEEIVEILDRAREGDPLLPEVYYQFSRYFRKLKETNRENLALRTTLELLQGEEPATRKRLTMLILAHNRIGEILYGQEAFLDAETEYRKALEKYEEAKTLRRLSPRREFGKIYANIGDLYYYVAGDYKTALDLFLEGEKNLYISPDVQYRKGYIYYQREDYRKALEEFYAAAEKYSEDTNLLYATASSFYMRNDFFSAQGYYNQLIEKMEKERESIQTLLVNERPEHRALIENLMIAYNNLGVTLNRLYLATGDPGKNADSLVQFTRSSEYFDSLTRDPETLRRSNTINLAHINTKNLLYPVTDYRLQTYRNLPKDRQTFAFR